MALALNDYTIGGRNVVQILAPEGCACIGMKERRWLMTCDDDLVLFSPTQYVPKSIFREEEMENGDLLFPEAAPEAKLALSEPEVSERCAYEAGQSSQ